MIRILAIETSCDETALSVIEADGGTLSPVFNVLGNALSSQAELHAEFGGVFPAIAKREHGKAITELLGRALTEANVLSMGEIEPKRRAEALAYLDREPEAKENLAFFFEKYGVPKIDLICVTSGPGLEPALWVGISVARALSVAWQKPVMPVNHMEGHIVSVLLQAMETKKDDGAVAYTMPKIQFPAIALLVSGGHTEIHSVKTWNNYKLLGATVDDAIGEAFDKSARLLGLPYPGGPKISALAKIARDNNEPTLGPKNIPIILPRPMLTTKDFNFSYSGLKTAVLYLVRDIKKANGDKELDDKTKRAIAREFEDAALEVVITKTLKAVAANRAKSIIVGGGVAANNRLRELLVTETKKQFPHVQVIFPERELSTDNSLMIAMAGYFSYLRNNRRGIDIKKIVAVGNLKITQ
jgi:N6-L-threonylcarbamoyladenine synthase